jgi:2-C-methyl-D-erythritol 2,4-cyclodiphosphate synthase
LGDIGRHFPDGSKDYENIDSRILLRKVADLLRGKSLRVGNVDVTVIAQRPKLAPHVAAMRRNLAEDLQIGEGQVNIKATTTEGMGFTGRGEGIAAHAVALLIGD